ncbi:MAG: DUF3857 domain-containing protein [Chlamydiales bacterium]|nr:DUF3857 domain-containing protein [Chlamydiales bacterium]
MIGRCLFVLIALCATPLSLSAAYWPYDECIINDRAKIAVYCAEKESTEDTLLYQTPVPRWVTHLVAPPSPKPSGEDAQILLVDKQVNVDNETTYYHIIKRLITPEGIQRHSLLEITFDPSYQTVTLHTIALYRLGQRVDFVATEDVHLMPAGKANQWSFVTIATNIREGDTLEYSYSIQGINPSYMSRTVDDCAFQYPFPVERIFYRVTGGNPSRIMVKTHQMAIEPTPQELPNDQWEWIWNATHVKPYESEPLQPTWYQNGPWVQISEFSDWSDVALWGSNLLRLPPTVPKSLKAMTKQWMQQYPEPAERALAALRYVQDEIELLDMPEPHDPSEIMNIVIRGAGDTVDKAYLLRVLLRLMNIESTAAGVSTVNRHMIDGWLASPTAFDRIILRLNIGGNAIWVDPTISQQGGELQSLSCGIYERTLLFEPTTRELTCLGHALEMPGIETKTSYYLWPDKLESCLLVETSLRGTNADSMRQTIQVLGRDKLCLMFQRAYEQIHGELENACVPEITDDRINNIIVIREHYHVKNPWHVQEQGRRKHLSLYPVVLSAQLPTPSEEKRKAPLALDYPTYVLETIQIIAPGHVWDIDSVDNHFVSNSIDSHINQCCQGDTLTMQAELRILSDHVAPNEINEYVQVISDLKNAAVVNIDLPTHFEKQWDVTYPFLINLYLALAIAFLAIEPKKHQ